MEKQLGIKPQLVKGTGGVFEVTVDGELVFSKKKTGRFPDPGEITGKLQAKAVGSP
jgi:selenoprotein W-related protein